MDAVNNRDKKTLAELIKKRKESGAEVVNLQCSLDGVGDEETLPWVTKVMSDTADIGVSLDSRNVQAIKKSMTFCKKPPLINFISETEPEDYEALLSLVSGSGASLVMRALKGGTIPTSLETKLQILDGLLEIANESDIPNQRLFADPSIVHISRGSGQKHLSNSYECIRVLKEFIEPPVNTILWISNVSAGLPKASRKFLEATLLVYMAGAGLDAAVVDVLDKNIRKAIYLIKSFRDEIVFSKADIT